MAAYLKDRNFTWISWNKEQRYDPLPPGADASPAEGWQGQDILGRLGARYVVVHLRQELDLLASHGCIGKHDSRFAAAEAATFAAAKRGCTADFSFFLGAN